jgi:hypothetical protein
MGRGTPAPRTSRVQAEQGGGRADGRVVVVVMGSRFCHLMGAFSKPGFRI